MTKQKSTKRALLLSALALLLCVSMLVGSTFAWFTDSVTSAGNKIVAGTLDVDLYLWNGTQYAEITNESAPIFGAGGLAQNVNGDTLWEPGKTQVAYLMIKNAGNLALKYSVALDVVNVKNDLYKVMKYAITPDAKDGTGVSPWTTGKSVQTGSQVVTTTDGEMLPNSEHYFALSIHMDETAGNEYQAGQVNFDLKVLATQLTAEEDSFNNQYDKDATMPSTGSAKVPAGRQDDIRIPAGNVAVTVPKEADAGNYVVNVSNKAVTTDDEGKSTFSADIDLLKDGVKVESNNNVKYTVKIDVGTGKSIDEVLHKGEKITNYTYDCYGTGIISFEVSSFSPFTVEMHQYDEDVPVVYIYSLDDFTAFGKAVNANTTYGGFAVANNNDVRVELMADIDMTDAPDIQGGEFSIGNGNNLQFTGTFDGNGHTISNYHIEGSWTYNVSLFRTTSGNFTMLDVTFDNCSASKPNNRNSSLIVGTIGGGTITFKNVTVKNTTINGVAGSSAFAGKMTEGALYFDNCKAENVTLKASSESGYNGMFLYDGYSHHDYEESGVWVKNCTITNCKSIVNNVEDTNVKDYNYTK